MFLSGSGVAALTALLQTRSTSSQVQLLAPKDLVWLDAESVVLPKAWQVDVREGAVAFREHGAITLRKAAASAAVGRFKRFGNADFTPENLKMLRASLKSALIKEGLFADEAEAMLNTWQHSWFAKPGLRVFYVVPRAWTDHFLPLTLSVPARITRVIVGRIDLPATP